MSKIGRESKDREVLKRKRFKRIHSKILKAKEKLDNVGKNDNKKKQTHSNFQLAQNNPKISTRLLPKAALGMYRNGAKGKDIQKAEMSESTFDRARMNADALKLINDDTSEYRKNPSTQNEAIEQSPSKNYVQNSLNWTQGSSEQSPILGENKHLKHLSKKKCMKDLLKYINSEEIGKQNDELEYVDQNENIFNLFRNDEEQSKDIIVTQIHTFDKDDFMTKNEKMQKVFKDNRNRYGELKSYVEVCEETSKFNFGEDSQMNQPDAVTTTVEKLRHGLIIKAAEYVLKKRRQLKAVEYQTYEYSDISQDSTSEIEYEVPTNNSENSSKAEKGEPYLQSDNVAHYGSTSCSWQDSVVPDDTDGCIMEKHETNNNSKRLADIHQPSTSSSFSFVNEKDSVQKDFNHINHSPKTRRRNRDYFDFSENVHINNAKHAAETSISLNDFKCGNELKSYTCEESLIDLSNGTINKCNAMNIEQSVIRYNDVTTERDRSVERSDENNYDQPYIHDLYNEYEIDVNNENPDNERYAYADSFHQQFLHEKIKRESEAAKSLDLSMEYQSGAYSTASQISPNSISTFKVDEIPKYNNNHVFKFPSRKDVFQREDKFHSSYIPTPIMNEQSVNFYDRVETFEPQIESMKMKDSEDSQESLINQFDINMHPNKLDKRNCKLSQFDNLQTLEAPYNANSYTERLIREQAMPLKKRLLHHSLNSEHDDEPESSSDNNVNVQTKLLPRRNQLHTSKNDDGRREYFGNKIRESWNVGMYGFSNRSSSIIPPSSSSTLDRRLHHSFNEHANEPESSSQNQLYTSENNDERREYFENNIRDRNRNVLLNRSSLIMLSPLSLIVDRRLQHSLHEHAKGPGYSNDNIDVEPTNMLPQRNQLYTSENDDGRREYFENNIRDRNRNVLFNRSSSTIHPSIFNKRHREPAYEEIFNKPDVEYSRNAADLLYHRDNQHIYLDSADQREYINVSQARHFYEEAAQPEISWIENRNAYSSTDNYIDWSNDVQSMPNTLFLEQKRITCPEMYDGQHRAVLPQHVAQPVKFFAADNNSNIQRVPVYMNDDGSVIRSIPVKVITRIT